MEDTPKDKIEVSIEQANAEDSQSTSIEANKSISITFFVFIGIGILAIFFNFRWWIPSLLILLYFVIGRRMARQLINLEKFGDSLYFMGFVFTLIALVVGMDPFGGSSESLKSTQILKMMGIALTTTVVGMILRLWVTHFRPTISDQESDARTDIAVLVEKLHNEIDSTLNYVANLRDTILRDSLTATDSFVKSTQKRIESQITVLEESTDKASSSITEIAQKSLTQLESHNTEMQKTREKSSADLAKMMADLQSGIEQSITTSSGGMNEALGNVISQLDTSIESFNVKVSGIDLPTDILSSRLTPIVGELEASVQNMVSSLNNKTEELNTIENLMEKFQSIAQLSDNIESAYNKQKEVVDSLASGASNASQEIIKLASSMQELQQYILTLKNQVEEKGQSFHVDFDEKTSVITRHLEETREGTVGLKSTLDEVVGFFKNNKW